MGPGRQEAVRVGVENPISGRATRFGGPVQHPLLCVADHDKRCPVDRMAPGRILRIVELREHRLPQRAGIAQAGIAALGLEYPDQQRHRRQRRHLPMRDQKRAGTGIEERTRQPGQRLGAGIAIAGRGVAGRQDDPVGIQLQLRDFAGGQQSVIGFGCLGRNGQRNGRLRLVADEQRRFTCDQCMGCEIENPVVGKPGLLDIGLGRNLSEFQIGRSGFDILADTFQFVLRLR